MQVRGAVLGGRPLRMGAGVLAAPEHRGKGYLEAAHSGHSGVHWAGLVLLDFIPPDSTPQEGPS